MPAPRLSTVALVGIAIGVTMPFIVHEMLLKHPAPKDVAYSYAQQQGFSDVCFERPTGGVGDSEMLEIQFKRNDGSAGSATLTMRPEGSSWLFAQNWALVDVQAGSDTQCSENRWLSVNTPAIHLPEHGLGSRLSP